MADENQPILERLTRWNCLDCARRPLNLSVTLRSGQSFRWRQDLEGIWWGVVEKTALGLWQPEGQPDSPVYWQTWPEPNRSDLVSDYFRLGVDLESLYAQWVDAEPRIAEAVQKYRGLRILRQPPLECFFAFQCATCNTVTKIERSVHKLAERYGEEIRPHPPAPPPNSARRGGISVHPMTPFYAFPTLERLAEAEEGALRADLWGYRAPRVVALAQHLLSLPGGWLESLRMASYAEAKAALVGLHGIGEKLADCICLFALDKDAATPVDTHVRQIAHRLFLPELAEKSLTPRVYAAISSAYRERFGDYTGWAQQYLFLGELRHLKT